MAKEFTKEFIDFIKSDFAINITISTTHPSILFIKEGLLTVQLVPYHEIEFNKKIIPPNNLEIGTFIRIYEDQWRSKQDLIKSRISSALGNTERIYGRKCWVKKIDKSTCDQFLESNHLLGSCNSGFRLGLFYESNLVAVAAFAKSRIMIDSDVYYRSFELLRFASLKQTTIVGGLHKLLSNFIKEKNVKHLMTYIDLEWGLGNSFKALGFEAAGITEEQVFVLNPINHERKKCHEEENIDGLKYVIRNLGSMKLILNLRDN